MPFHEPPPIWLQQQVWSRAGAYGSTIPIDLPALTLLPEDPLVRFLPNCYRLWLGSFFELHHLGGELFEFIRRELELDSFTYWDGQREWLESTLKYYYPEREEGVGTVSFLPVRRPAHLRSVQDPSIVVRQSPAEVAFRRYRPSSKLPMTIGDLRLSLEGLQLETPLGLERGAVWAQTIVPRRVISASRGIDIGYREAWYCLADRREDRGNLVAGRIPAVPASVYTDRRNRLRLSSIVNLVKVSRDLHFSILVLEIDHASGKMLSLRWTRSPIGAALLNMSPVERSATEQALRRFAR